MTSNEYRNPASVSIGGTDVRVVTYKGEPVVTFAMVDEIHKRADGTAKRTFFENRERFAEGEDFVIVPSAQKDEFRTFEIDVPNRGLTVLTRRGYLKLVKPLTDDRAWEVQGEMIDRYFMVEKIAAMAPEVLEQIERSFGIMRKTIHKVTEMEKELSALPALTQAVTALTAIVQPGVPGVYRPGKTAGAILKANGFTKCPQSVAAWFGNRLDAAGCRVEGRIDTGTCRARLFDPDKAEAWLENGGRASVKMKIAERNGQGALALTGRGHRALVERSGPPIIPADIYREGVGAIFLEGEPVFFDIRDIKIGPGDRAVVVTAAGDVKVDTPRPDDPTYLPMGARGAMASAQMEAVPGRHDAIPVQWRCMILGKVIDRRNVVRLPSATA